MGKIVFRITLIICANLLAFLSVGLILDAIFKTGDTMKLASVILSLPVLGLIMYLKAGSILHTLQAIPPSHDDERNNTR